MINRIIKYNSGVSFTGWESYQSIVSGLPSFSNPYNGCSWDTCYLDGNVYLFKAEYLDTFRPTLINAYMWNGSGWVSNTAITVGLPSHYYGRNFSTFWYNGELLGIYLYGNTVKGFKWSGTGWTSYTTVATGISVSSSGRNAKLFERGSDFSYMISGIGYSSDIYDFYGHWTGTGWTDEATNAYLSLARRITSINYNGTAYVIIENQGYVFNGTSLELSSIPTNGRSAIGSGTSVLIDGIMYLIEAVGTSNYGYRQIL